MEPMRETIEKRLAELRQGLQTLELNRAATMGGIQILEQLLESMESEKETPGVQSDGNGVKPVADS